MKATVLFFLVACLVAVAMAQYYGAADEDLAGAESRHGGYGGGYGGGRGYGGGHHGGHRGGYGGGYGRSRGYGGGKGHHHG